MSANLLDLAKGYLTNEVVSKASTFLGEDQSTTQSAFDHILPTLLGGMVSKASDKTASSELFNMVTRPEFGGGLLNNLGGLFSQSETTNSTMNLGETLLRTLMGGRQSNVIDLISSAVGMKSGSASSLLKLGLPILLSVIGKKVKTDGLGLDGFINLIKGQDEYVKKAAPAGFLDKMLGAYGLSNFAASGSEDHTVRKVDTTPEREERTTATATTSQRHDDDGNGKSGLARILPILLILGALALAFYLFRNCNADAEGLEEDEEMTDTTAMEQMEDSIIRGADAIYGAGEDLVGKTVEGFENLGTFMKQQLGDGSEIIIPSKGGLKGLVDFIESDKEVDENAWFDLRRILFETGSANLDAKSQTQIDNILAIMKAYPNVHLKVGGYTDNTGDAAANLQLSEARANAVMNAIVTGGIDAARLTAEGYGQEHPVADNETEEGRQLNRRVALRVAQK